MAYKSHHSSKSKVSLVDVSDKTYATIEELIKSTFNPHMVGKGRDADNLDHWGIQINDIQEVKNGKLLREYRDFRDELREKTSDGDNVEEITDLPKKIEQYKEESRHVDLNEIYLFHGTSEDAANSIIHKGFNIGATDPNGLYGRGIYFAEKITKADQYSEINSFLWSCDEKRDIGEHRDKWKDRGKVIQRQPREIMLNGLRQWHGGISSAKVIQNTNYRDLWRDVAINPSILCLCFNDDREDREPNGTELTLLLCKVLMGNAFVCSRKNAKKFKRPPCMLCNKEDCPHGWENRYDSVLGSGGLRFREFVIYDEKQCYPEFLVNYERIGGWEPLQEYE